MSNLWWQNHRMLMRGMQGPDVEKIQHALNDFGYSPALVPDGDFGGLTETAVEWFQGMMRLVVDGKVGPVTRSVLMAGGYRVELPRPPHVPQGDAFLCWAACLESVLRRAWPGRPQKTVADFQSDYAPHLDSNGGISPGNLRTRVGGDLRFKEIFVGENVRAERLLNALGQHRPILLVDNALGGVLHVRVIYGLKIEAGAINVLMMDPLNGHVPVPLGEVQSLTQLGFFAPNEIVL